MTRRDDLGLVLSSAGKGRRAGLSGTVCFHATVAGHCRRRIGDRLVGFQIFQPQFQLLEVTNLLLRTRLKCISFSFTMRSFRFLISLIRESSSICFAKTSVFSVYTSTCRDWEVDSLAGSYHCYVTSILSGA